MFYIGGIFWKICAVLVSKIFCISPKESFPGISSMYFWVPFLIIQNAPITNGIVFFLVSVLFSLLFRGLCIWKACQILSVKYFYQQVQWQPTWCMFVLWSFWFLCLGDLYLFFYPCKQESLIAPLHFFFLLLIRLCVCTIFLSVVSCNACIVSICTWLLDHVSVSILCLLLLSIWYYVVYSLFVVFTQPTFRVNPIFKNFWLVHSCWNTLVLFCLD